MTSAFSSFGTRRQARSMISSSPSSEARCGKIVRIRTALAVEVSHQNFGLSARIWKNVHLARFQKNEEMNLRLCPRTAFSPKWSESRAGCGNDAPWEPWKSPTPTFPPFPPRLEIPQRTRDSHLSPATTAEGTVYH